MRSYYNEFDPQAAAWLRELIKAGLIPAGDVDERSIEDVKPADLRGYGNAIVPQQAAEFVKAYTEVAGLSAMREAA